MIFSLERRFLLLMLLPVTLILVLVGSVGFFYMRSYLLEQWVEATKLRLEKVVHQVSMRLDAKLELINLIAKADGIPNSALTQAFLIQQLVDQDGVVFVDVDFVDANGGDPAKAGLTNNAGEPDAGLGLYTMELCGDFGFCAPVMETGALDRSLRIVKILGAGDENTIRRLIVRVSFDSFLDAVREMGLWPGSSACLVTSTGQFLAHTDKSMGDRKRLGETGDELEKQVLKEMRKSAFGTVFGKGHPPEWVAGYYKIPQINWYLMLFSRGHVILDPIISFRIYYAIAGIVSLVVILVLIRMTTRSVSKSIGEISTAAALVAQGDYTTRLPEGRSDEIGRLKRSFNEMIEGLRQRDIIEQTFGRYVDKNVAAELLSSPEALRLGGEKRTVTIMMSDLRDFTPLSEKLEPEDVIKLLNRYFGRMIAVIERYKGIIVDFYGDSILVFFNGVEKDIPGRAFDAVCCALEMQRELDAFVSQNAGKGIPELSMGIGIHTGEVVVGNIGTETRAKYGIVGSDVNLTDRIQHTAGAGKVVISEQTHEIICGSLKVAQEFRVCLKGVEEDKKLYEIEAVDAACEFKES